MKVMTCKQLGGACELEFRAPTFQEMAKLSQAHGTEMFQQKEPAHLQAMNEMRTLMNDPSAMGKWMADKEAEFNQLPEV